MSLNPVAAYMNFKAVFDVGVADGAYFAQQQQAVGRRRL